LREIEDEVEPYTPPLLSKWSKERIAQGRAQGKREGLQRGRRDGQHEGRQQALVLVLGSRGLVPTAAQMRRIQSCTSSRQLDAWLRRAAAAESVAQLLSRRASS
jgi:flagellar biosynthesis/type III secretory pathway protein FliH